MVTNGQQIVPSAWIDDIRNHRDNAPWSRNELWSTVFPKGHYRTFWYNTEDEHHSYLGIGVFGQTYWIDPTSRVVIVKISTQPTATDADMAVTTLRGMAAIGKALLN